MRGKLALITGATSGIGESCAELLAAKGCHLILTGRRDDRLREICARLEREHRINAKPLLFDVSVLSEVNRALTSIEADLARLDILINNAGLALGAEPLQVGEIQDWETMIDTNVKGLLYVTRFCLPHMVKRDQGHVVNLGSAAGRWTYPGGGVYCATKFAVRALSDNLRMDLLGKRIRVTNIEPGMVETPFSEIRYKGDKEKAANVYKGVDTLKARDIAESIVWCLERPAHVNIQEMVIFPTDQVAVGAAYIHRR